MAFRTWFWVGPTHCPPISATLPWPSWWLSVRPPTRSRASRTTTERPAFLSTEAAFRPAKPGADDDHVDATGGGPRLARQPGEGDARRSGRGASDQAAPREGALAIHGRTVFHFNRRGPSEPTSTIALWPATSISPTAAGPCCAG